MYHSVWDERSPDEACARAEDPLPQGELSEFAVEFRVRTDIPVPRVGVQAFLPDWGFWVFLGVSVPNQHVSEYYFGEFEDVYMNPLEKECVPLIPDHTTILRVHILADLTQTHPRLTVWVNGRQFPPYVASDGCTIALDGVEDPPFIENNDWFPAAFLDGPCGELLTGDCLE